MLATLVLLAAPAGASGRSATEPTEPTEPTVQEIDRSADASATDRERRAARLLKQANEAVDYDDVVAALNALCTEAPSRYSCPREPRMEVIGRDAGEMDVDVWFQREATMGDGKTTVLVFWEVWSPHCKDEMLKLEATYQMYQSKGIDVVGVTKMTRNVTEEQVNTFLSENQVTYPVAKEMGTVMSERFGVKAIPAAAVVKGGKIVWRGHPANITDAMIDGWVE